MSEYSELLKLAEDDLQFLHRYGECWFLARRHRLGVEEEASSVDHFAFRTIEEPTNPCAGLRWDVPLAALTKRPGNPFPSRISIGRAPNCDVVIRLPFVSKLHAHVLVEGDQRWIQDAGSSCGTFHNGTRLPTRHRSPLTLGDELVFGVQPTRVIDVGRALRLLQR